MVYYHHILHLSRKHFSRYYLQTFSTEILKSHANVSFKVNGKHMIKKPKKGESVRFRNYQRKKVTIHKLCLFWKSFGARG